MFLTLFSSVMPIPSSMMSSRTGSEFELFPCYCVIYLLIKYLFIGSSWCLTCKELTKLLCRQKKHKVTNFMKDVEEFDGWLDEAGNGVNEVNGKWEQGGKELLVKKEKMKKHQLNKEKLQVKMKTFDSLLEDMEKGKEKLRLISATCDEMKLLPPSTKTSVFMRKNLRQTIADVKKEKEKAEEFLKAISIQEMEQEIEVNAIHLMIYLNL